MSGAYLSEISSYPVKSLAGGGHQTAQVHPWGLAQDRSWMIVDQAGRFLTQREHPRMAVLQASSQGDALLLRAPAMMPLGLPSNMGATKCVVRVWRDDVPATDCGNLAAAWLRAALGVPCRLVHLDDPHARKLRPDYARGQDEVVSFADGFPVLLTSAASLADLNTRLAASVLMSRFRPNLVIDGAAAWAEDTWQRVRIGGVIFRVAKPCDRCVMTTIDQQTGERPDANEPLGTLGTFRRDISGKIMFGQNLVPEGVGDIRVRDRIIPVETGPSNVELRAIDQQCRSPLRRAV